MSHRNAALTPRHRLRVARLVIEEGWPISEVAARFQVSWPTVKRWVDRYLAGEPMQDRSSRPKSSPNKTSKKTTKRCVSLRMRLREGPVQLAARLGIAPATVHRILTTARMNRLSYVDRATGEPIRRYEHDHPGSLVHVDVKNLGNIPDGGGWRYVGRRQGSRNRAVTPGKPKNKWRNPKLGYAFVHTIIDDHSRVAYTEVHNDEYAVTAVGVLHRAVEWFADRGVALLSASCPITVVRTVLTCGETRARLYRSLRSERGHTAHRPTARSSDSTAPWPTAGRMRAATRARTNAAMPSPTGSTSTTSTDHTPPAEASRPSHD